MASSCVSSLPTAHEVSDSAAVTAAAVPLSPLAAVFSPRSVPAVSDHEVRVPAVGSHLLVSPVQSGQEMASPWVPSDPRQVAPVRLRRS